MPAEIVLSKPLQVMGESIAALTLPDELTLGDLWDIDLDGPMTLGRLGAIAAKVARWTASNGEARTGVPAGDLRKLSGGDIGRVVAAVGPLLAACLAIGAASPPTSVSPAASPSGPSKR